MLLKPMIIPENLIRSASITADAWQCVTWIVTTQEHQFFGAGGQLSTVRAGSLYSNFQGQPTVPLLAVLPFDYFPPNPKAQSKAC